MAIRLDWASLVNKAYDRINIYRSATPFDFTQPLPAPYATVAADIVTYTDNTVADNTAYWYLVAGEKGGLVTAGVPVSMGNFPDTGPGPKDIIRGNWFSGYFGEVSLDEMFTLTEIKAQITTMSAFNLIAPSFWHKFVFNGKILFFPDKALTNSGVTWSALYTAGVMYGSDTVGEKPAGVTNGPTFTVMQSARMTKGGWSFKVRLPLMSLAPTTSYVPNEAATVDSEYRNTIARTFLQTSLSTYGKSKVSDCAPWQIHTQHWIGNTQTGIMTATESFTFATPTTSNAQWWPILELEY